MASKKPPTLEPTAQLPDEMEVVLLRDGVKACGKYKHGEVYSVSGEEGKRLIDVKGFTEATAAVKDEIAQISAKKEG